MIILLMEAATSINPYGLSSEIIWILEVIVPSLLVIIGWISLVWINKINIHNDKLLESRIKAYDHLREKILKAEIDINNFYFYVITLHSMLVRIANDKDNELLNNMFYDSINANESKYNELSLLEMQSFNDFVYTWEGYRILYTKLEKVYSILYEKHCELNELWNEFYTKYLMHLHSNIRYKNDIQIDLTTLNSLETIYIGYLDLIGYITDFSGYLQNDTYSKLSRKKVKERKPTEEQFNTLNQLVKRK